MEKSKLIEEAIWIAKRNADSSVALVALNFDPSRGHLRLYFYLDTSPTEDQIYECELTCAEICAAFPDGRTAETFYPMKEHEWFGRKLNDVIYRRESASLK